MKVLRVILKLLVDIIENFETYTRPGIPKVDHFIKLGVISCKGGGKNKVVR